MPNLEEDEGRRILVCYYGRKQQQTLFKTIWKGIKSVNKVQFWDIVLLYHFAKITRILPQEEKQQLSSILWPLALPQVKWGEPIEASGIRCPRERGKRRRRGGERGQRCLYFCAGINPSWCKYTTQGQIFRKSIALRRSQRAFWPSADCSRESKNKNKSWNFRNDGISLFLSICLF